MVKPGIASERPTLGRRYLPIYARAFRNGASESWISPLKGVYISTIKKIAPETATAHRNKVATTVVLVGEKKAKTSENND